eukprot:7744896-Heterocapsa_arctica.AAC.1
MTSWGRSLPRRCICTGGLPSRRTCAARKSAWPGCPHSHSHARALPASSGSLFLSCSWPRWKNQQMYLVRHSSWVPWGPGWKGDVHSVQGNLPA